MIEIINGSLTVLVNLNTASIFSPETAEPKSNFFDSNSIVVVGPTRLSPDSDAIIPLGPDEATEEIGFVRLFFACSLIALSSALQEENANIQRYHQSIHIR